MWFLRRHTSLMLCGLVLLWLAGCGTGPESGEGNAVNPATPLALNHPYREGGITVTVTRYAAPVDLATTPISAENRLPDFHVVLIVCTLTNTTGSDLDVETRLQSSASGGGGVGKLVDVPPAAINEQDMHGKTGAALDAVDLVRAGATVSRMSYFQVDPDLTAMAFYLNTWTPGSSSNDNLPPLFTVSIPSHLS